MMSFDVTRNTCNTTQVMPWLYPVVEAARDAGAKGAFLSGAGSSIMALSVGLRGER